MMAATRGSNVVTTSTHTPHFTTSITAEVKQQQQRAVREAVSNPHRQKGRVEVHVDKHQPIYILADTDSVFRSLQTKASIFSSSQKSDRRYSSLCKQSQTLYLALHIQKSVYSDLHRRKWEDCTAKQVQIVALVTTLIVGPPPPPPCLYTSSRPRQTLVEGWRQNRIQILHSITHRRRVSF